MSENLMSKEIIRHLDRLGITYAQHDFGDSVLGFCKNSYGEEIPAPLQEFIRNIQIPQEASYSAPFRLSFEEDDDIDDEDVFPPEVLEILAKVKARKIADGSIPRPESNDEESDAEDDESGFNRISSVMFETQEDLAGTEYVSLMMLEITQWVIVFSLKDETPEDPYLYFMSHDEGELDDFKVRMSEFFSKLTRNS